MPNALFSVSNKTGLLDFARELHTRGWSLIASSGTAQMLTGAGLPVHTVSEITGEPEILGGRVKTLHPAIHAALLARNITEDLETLAARGWAPIDLVVVNLYPFKEVISHPGTNLERAVENIDIGGVALLRAAAKNFERVTVLCDPADYLEALEPDDPAAFRLRMAHKAFAHTAAYDAAIEGFFAQIAGKTEPLQLNYYPALELRYGENPHQRATFYSQDPEAPALGGELLQGKPLSYNNILDLDVAWTALTLFEQPAVMVVKHTSPCGIATAPTTSPALKAAIASDPISAFGSVIACNREIDPGFVADLDDLFVECLAAPAFTQDALEALKNRKNMRLLRMTNRALNQSVTFRSALGGLLTQEVDLGDPSDARAWEVVTEREPTDREMADLRFAWRACQPVKSNAIVLAKSDGDLYFTVGIGGGQPNRVDCVRIAGARAGNRAPGCVMASDAFFPFPDGVEAAADLGVTAVVQPGGSLRDQEAIKAANAAGLSMIFTGVRHFRH